jgi:hypothetical protein
MELTSKPTRIIVRLDDDLDRAMIFCIKLQNVFENLRTASECFRVFEYIFEK